ncbi:hypothetical protein UA08_00384 [Talaromyces atroroseus]|uniref:Uncharacterized protein n=1 Tax=Talaromyces atroroseus TaxID=1441469 RepID=A0A225AVM1_TALAT|nr:hypothetical protein UA08_00384 [Talaromyces atroroseus]OKL63663.1 hypothetical protein UA08_00384 [Talaromyces atroroseus]
MASSGRDRSSEADTQTLNKTAPPPDDAARPWTDSENPFIAFRRYADEQISSMMQSIMDLPSMAPPFSDKWLYFEDKNDSRAMRKEEVGHDSDPRSDNHWRPSRWGHYHRDNDFFNYWDAHRRSSDSGFHSSFDGFPLGFGFPFLLPESMFCDGDEETWPLAYILFSSYSPLHLERAHHRGRHQRRIFSSLFSSRKSAELDPNEPRWRDAFEDLIRVTNGQELLDQSTESERTTQSADKWLRGLVQRGSLGNNWKLLGPESSPHGVAFERLEQHNSNKHDQEPPSLQDTRENIVEGSDSETELDLYDRFLDDIAKSHERYSHAFADSPLMRLLDEERKRHMRQAETPQASIEETVQSKDWLEYTSDGNKNLLASQSTTDDDSTASSRIVSTMTRSVRRTLTDGSISTKTVKTKRFADGREESDESVEVTPPPSAEVNTHHSRTSEEDKENNDSGRGGGWFWTR